VLVLALFDQLTKAFIVRILPPGEEITVFPGFLTVVHVHNTGAAFSMFHGNNLILGLLAVAVLTFLVILRGKFPGWLAGSAWVLLVSGIIGNLTDRILRGHVVDFLDFQFGSYHWPAFNVADSCICLAACLFLISGFSSRGAEAKKG